LSTKWQKIIRLVIDKNFTAANQLLADEGLGRSLELLRPDIPVEKNLEHLYHTVARNQPELADLFRQAVVRLLKDYNPRYDKPIFPRTLLHLVVNLQIEDSVAWIYRQVYKRRYEHVSTPTGTLYRDILAALVDYVPWGELPVSEEALESVFQRSLESKDTGFLGFRGLWELRPTNFFEYFPRLLELYRPDRPSTPFQRSVLRYIRYYGWSVLIEEWQRNFRQSKFSGDPHLFFCQILYSLGYEFCRWFPEHLLMLVVDVRQVFAPVAKLPYSLVAEFLNWRDRMCNTPDASPKLAQEIDKLLKEMCQNLSEGE